jgi:hypothetical protein
METSRFDRMNRARREFLAAAKGVGVLGAIALLAGKGTAVDGAAVMADTMDESPDSGYRETEHIRKYYRSTRY